MRGAILRLAATVNRTAADSTFFPPRCASLREPVPARVQPIGECRKASLAPAIADCAAVPIRRARPVRRCSRGRAGEHEMEDRGVHRHDLADRIVHDDGDAVAEAREALQETLQRADLSGPRFHVSGVELDTSMRNVMREDAGAHERGKYTEVLLSAAPAREGNRVAVKQVISRKNK